LKPNCDKLLSNFAFNFDLRRYSVEAAEAEVAVARGEAARELAAAAEAREAGAYTRSLSAPLELSLCPT